MSVCECVRTRILHWKKIYIHGVCIRNASVGCYLFIHTSMYVQVHGCVYAYTVSTVVQPLSCNLRRNFGRYLVICLYVNSMCLFLLLFVNYSFKKGYALEMEYRVQVL